MTAANATPTNPISTYVYGYGDANWGDKLTSYRGQAITYDEIGNPLSYYNGRRYTFTWENGRRLATATVGGTNLSFTYNDEGIRTSKTVGTVEHIYHLNGPQIVFEESGETVIVYLYDAEGSPIGMQYRTGNADAGIFEEYWFEKNLQGDIVAVYDGAGTKLISYTYDAWGNFTTTYHNGCTASHHANLNPFRYRGYYYDVELGMYYLQSRYYDPQIGRFINADAYVSTEQGLLGNNMLAYCGNNPITRIDRVGHFWADAFQSFCNSFCSAMSDSSGTLAFAGGIAQTDTIALGPADAVGIAIAAGTVLTCIGKAIFDTWLIKKEQTNTQGIVLADTLVGSKRNTSVFYGADIRGGDWNLVTGPMDFDTALAWVGVTAADKIYGKRASWGVYTEKQADAIAMAAALGGGVPCWHGKNLGQYNHYHVAGMLLFGEYSHFHIWYGSIWEG